MNNIFHFCAFNDNNDYIIDIITKHKLNIDINQQNNDGFTALMVCCQKNTKNVLSIHM